MKTNFKHLFLRFCAIALTLFLLPDTLLSYSAAALQTAIAEKAAENAAIRSVSQICPDDMVMEIMTRLNIEREKNGVPLLKTSPEMKAALDALAKEYAQNRTPSTDKLLELFTANGLPFHKTDSGSYNRSFGKAAYAYDLTAEEIVNQIVEKGSTLLTKASPIYCNVGVWLQEDDSGLEHFYIAIVNITDDYDEPDPDKAALEFSQSYYQEPFYSTTTTTTTTTEETTTTTIVTTEPVVTTVLPEEYVELFQATDDRNRNLEEMAYEAEALINDIRIKAGVKALKTCPYLHIASHERAKELSRNYDGTNGHDYINHLRPIEADNDDDRKSYTIMAEDKLGFTYEPNVEYGILEVLGTGWNEGRKVVYGNENSAERHDAWFYSKGHYETLIAPDLEYFAVEVYYDPNGAGGAKYYWEAMFLASKTVTIDFENTTIPGISTAPEDQSEIYEIESLINQKRVEYGYTPYKTAPMVQTLAMTYANDVAENFNKAKSPGFVLLRQYHVPDNYIIGSIKTQGDYTPQELVDYWWNDIQFNEHLRGEVLNENNEVTSQYFYTHFAVAIARSTDPDTGEEHKYYTVIFLGNHPDLGGEIYLQQESTPDTASLIEERINAIRAENNLPPLRTATRLRNAAAIRAEELMTTFYRDNSLRPEHKKGNTVLTEVGIPATLYYGEVRERGMWTLDELMETWTSEHHTNDMEMVTGRSKWPDEVTGIRQPMGYSHIGAAVRYVPDDPNGHYYYYCVTFLGGTFEAFKENADNDDTERLIPMRNTAPITADTLYNAKEQDYILNVFLQQSERTEENDYLNQYRSDLEPPLPPIHSSETQKEMALSYAKQLAALDKATISGAIYEGGSVNALIDKPQNVLADCGYPDVETLITAWKNDATTKALLESTEYNAVSLQLHYVPEDPNGYYYYWSAVFFNEDGIVTMTPPTMTTPVDTTDNPETTTDTIAPDGTDTMETTDVPADTGQETITTTVSAPTTDVPPQTTAPPIQTTIITDSEGVEHIFLLGDVDGDYDIDIDDAVLVLNFYAKQSASLPANFNLEDGFIRADINRDSNADITDAVYILTYYSQNSASLSPDWSLIVK